MEKPLSNSVKIDLSLIAKYEWFGEELSDVMNIQGRFGHNNTTLRVIDYQSTQTA